MVNQVEQLIDGQPGDSPDAMQATCKRYLAMMKEYLS
jgi:hypothetical protein